MTGDVLRVAYADPPYLGLASRYDHPESHAYDTVEGHVELFHRLEREFPAGWAYSLHAPALRTLLPACPYEVRVCAWVKPFASFKKGVNPGYAWEPVLLRGGRKKRLTERTTRDWVSANITLERGFFGAKPERFCWWVFDLLGLRPGDEFVDVFPGSGAVTRAWAEYCRQAEGLFPLTLPSPA
jgi:hypothetical protein